MNPTLQSPATPDDPAEALAWLVEDSTFIRDATPHGYRILRDHRGTHAPLPPTDRDHRAPHPG